MKIRRTNIRLHRWIGLALSIQILFWMASGFFFSLYPIEVIRGEHLTRPLPQGADLGTAALLPPSELGVQARSITLRWGLDGPVYEVRAENGHVLFDAETGEQLSPITEDLARRTALALWDGEGELAQLDYLEKPPREAAGAGPLWRAEFKGKTPATLYVTAETGRLRAVRTQNWRIFDFLWGLHIMDWAERENFSSWWLKLFAGAGLLFSLTGILILIDQLRRGKLWSRAAAWGWSMPDEALLSVLRRYCWRRL